MTWPFENDTRSTVKKLAKRSLKARKNTVAILAILLATLLLTGLFTVAMNIQKACEQSAMRSIGTYAHAGLKNVTIEEYEELAADDRWIDCGYSIVIGQAVGSEFAKLNTEIRWADDYYAETSFCLPTTGRMPVAEDELATSRLVLQALGLPCELGTTVPLTFKTDTETITKTFTLCGVWDGDPAAGAQNIWLSRVYSDQIAPVRHGSSVGAFDSETTGYVHGSFMLSSDWQMEERAFQIFAEHDMGDEFHYNYAYSMSDITASELLPVLAMALLVLLAGYLLIYNVFYISIAQDTCFYGLLKTVGATSKQLRQLVYKKAMQLSAVGIPLGLALGWLLGTVLSPAILENMSTRSVISIRSASPVIFLAGAAFALLTVFISCSKPARIAGRVSPMEVLHYNEAVMAAKGDRRDKPITPARMACQNLGRGKKKVIMVVLSLALSLVILNSVASFAWGFDFEAFISNSLVNDFAVADTGVVNHLSAYDSRLSAVDSTLQEIIATLDGLEGMGNIYAAFADQPITEELSAIIRDAGRDEKIAQSHMYQDALDQMEGTVDTLGNMTYCLYALDDYAAQKLAVLEGKLDWDKWRSGQGVFITPALLWDGEYCLYHPGDTMSVDLTELVKGEEYNWYNETERTVKTYEVLAVVEYPSAYGCGSGMGSGTGIILPEAEYLTYACENNQFPMMTVFDVDDEHIDAAEAFVQDYTENVDPTMDYRSLLTKQNEFRDFIRMFTLVSGALCILLALIGILNFINSMTTSILTRRREIAMLQSVGMTGEQVKRMLVFEGLGYAVLGIALALVLAAIVNVTLLWAFTADMSFFNVRFTLAPVLLTVPPLLAVTALVPWLCYRKMARTSIVERLRLTE